MMSSSKRDRDSEPIGITYLDIFKHHLSSGPLNEALDGNGLFARKNIKQRAMMESHHYVLASIIDKCRHPRKTTLQNDLKALNLFYCGQLAEGDQGKKKHDMKISFDARAIEDWSRREAYAVKAMIMEVENTSKHLTTGERLPDWLRNLCAKYRQASSKVRLGRFAMSSQKRLKSPSKKPLPLPCITPIAVRFGRSPLEGPGKVMRTMSLWDQLQEEAHSPQETTLEKMFKTSQSSLPARRTSTSSSLSTFSEPAMSVTSSAKKPSAMSLLADILNKYSFSATPICAQVRLLAAFCWQMDRVSYLFWIISSLAANTIILSFMYSGSIITCNLST